jgi:hypothetical protein
VLWLGGSDSTPGRLGTAPEPLQREAGPVNPYDRGPQRDGERSGGLAHDGPYGSLVGKTVALEAASGFSFDALLESRPR